MYGLVVDFHTNGVLQQTQEHKTQTKVYATQNRQVTLLANVPRLPYIVAATYRKSTYKDIRWIKMICILYISFDDYTFEFFNRYTVERFSHRGELLVDGGRVYICVWFWGWYLSIHIFPDCFTPIQLDDLYS